MAVDEALLRAHAGFEDDASGLREEFLRVELAGAPTVALLTTPLGKRRATGWVLCHSLALEFVHLSRLETNLARALASAGFPVLRFHGRGHGDGEPDMASSRLSTHVEEAADAVALLRERAGVLDVGAAGARFGGLVAALAADRLRLPALAVVDPVVRGAVFARDFLRRAVLSEIVAGGDDGRDGDGADGTGRAAPAGPIGPAAVDGAGVRRLRARLERMGWADVYGFLLSLQAYRELSEADLTRDLRAFRGSAYVLGLSRSGGPSPAAHRLAARVRELGGDCREDVIRDRLAPTFGQHHHRNDAGARKTDLAVGLYGTIVERVVAWAVAVGDATEGSAGVQASAGTDTEERGPAG